MKARSGAARGAGSGEREKWTAGAENPDGHRSGFDPDEAPPACPESRSLERRPSPPADGCRRSRGLEFSSPAEYFGWHTASDEGARNSVPRE
jgi:hypothetical protein